MVYEIGTTGGAIDVYRNHSTNGVMEFHGRMAFGAVAIHGLMRWGLVNSCLVSAVAIKNVDNCRFQHRLYPMYGPSIAKPILLITPGAGPP